MDAITATAMFIDVEKLRMINGWDNNIFAYYDDIDLCLRFKILGFEIIKIKNSEVNHEGFLRIVKSFIKRWIIREIFTTRGLKFIS